MTASATTATALDAAAGEVAPMSVEYSDMKAAPVVVAAPVAVTYQGRLRLGPPGCIT